MPFTLSHPAVVLPLRRLGLPMTGLVFGSMVPDIPLFLRWDWGYAVTHSLAGALVVDPLATLVLLCLWFGIVRDALVDLAPATVRSRLTVTGAFSKRHWVLALPAAALGALTHVAWDAFTHPHRWGVGQVTWLQTGHAGLPGYKWAQYVSGVAGLAVVCLAVFLQLRALPTIQAERPRRVLSPIVLYVAVGLAAAAGLVAAASARSDGLHDMAFDGALASLTAAALGTTAVCAAWQVVSRRRRQQ